VGGVWATTQEPGGQPPEGEGAASARPATGVPRGAGEPAARTADSAQRRRSLHNLKQILVAFHNYDAAHNHLPGDIRDKAGKPLLSWRVAILPYVERDNLDRQFKLDEPWDSEHNLKLLSRMPTVYRVGIEPNDATHTYYQVFAGPGTPFGPSRFGPPGAAGERGGAGGAAGPAVGGPPGLGGDGSSGPPGLGGSSDTGGGAGAAPDAPRPVRLVTITDGTSNTLGVVEAGPAVAWTKPADLPFDPKVPPKPAGPFANVLHAATMDGATHAFKPNLDTRVLRVLIGMDDGELTPDLRTLRAALPAETPEEKAVLAAQIARNQELVGEVEQLLREQVGLLGGRNRGIGDLGQAEDQAERLKQMAEQLRAQNKKLRAELGLKDGDPGPGRGVK
jgi:hypothetical protein